LPVALIIPHICVREEEVYMGQVTIYLDSETEANARAAAKAENASLSQWIADLIRERTADTWPAEVKKLAGAWADLPDSKESRAGLGKDAERETL
jgi:hypothetical protein